MYNKRNWKLITDLNTAFVLLSLCDKLHCNFILFETIKSYMYLGYFWTQSLNLKNFNSVSLTLNMTT